MNTGLRQHEWAPSGALGRGGRWRGSIGAAVIGVSAFVLMISAACGEDPAADNPGEAPFVLDPPLTSAATAPVDAGSAAPVFAELAQAAAPMTVYGIAELPKGATVPAEWWPIVDVETPSEYTGPPTANPRVIVGQEDDAQVQLVVEYQGGWGGCLQNFRGDLGDVQGQDVGVVDGHPARQYEVNGGVLVQWRDEGRWYGLFARGVAADEVIRLALQMRAIDPAGGG